MVDCDGWQPYWLAKIRDNTPNTRPIDETDLSDEHNRDDLELIWQEWRRVPEGDDDDGRCPNGEYDMDYRTFEVNEE